MCIRDRAAGADENTLAYVQENIDLRHAADRLGNSMEAVGKRWIASIPSYIDTAKQDIADRNDSLKNDEYNRLVEQEQQLELQLANMSSQDADGKVPADYQAVYDQLQDCLLYTSETVLTNVVNVLAVPVGSKLRPTRRFRKLINMTRRLHFRFQRLAVKQWAVNLFDTLHMRVG